MGSHDWSDSFLSKVEIFNTGKGTDVLARYSIGDRLTTGTSSAEPIQGCMFFGVSTRDISPTRLNIC